MNNLHSRLKTLERQTAQLPHNAAHHLQHVRSLPENERQAFFDSLLEDEFFDVFELIEMTAHERGEVVYDFTPLTADELRRLGNGDDEPLQKCEPLPAGACNNMRARIEDLRREYQNQACAA